VYAEAWQIIRSITWDAVLGGLLLLFAAVVGWVLERHETLRLVRGVAWWLRRVVVPLLSVRSWPLRALIIFANNATILACVVLCGRWRIVSAAAIASVGLTLGIALRNLSASNYDWRPPGVNAPSKLRQMVRAGVLLNLLEPPAIVLSVGLSLMQTRLPTLPVHDVWSVFAIIALPLLAIAACGEALWLGTGFYGGSLRDNGPSVP